MWILLNFCRWLSFNPFAARTRLIKTAEASLASAVFEISTVCLFAWYDEDHGKIYEDTGYAARDQGDEECEAEPEGAHPEKFSQSAAYPGDHAITAGTS